MFEFLGNIGSALGNAGKAVGNALGNVGGKIADVGGKVGGKIADVGGKVGGAIKSSPLGEKLAGGFEKVKDRWDEMSDEDKAKLFGGDDDEQQQVNPYAYLGDLSSNVNFNMQPLQQRQMQYYIPYERNFY